MRFCAECGEALHQESTTVYRCTKGHRTWNNPRAAAGIFLIQEKHVLFATRALEPQKGKYDIVGGFLNFNEDPWMAIRRETQEETGVTLQDLFIVDVVTHLYMPTISVTATIFASRNWRGLPRPKDDVAALEWHSPALINTPEFAWHLPGLAQKLQAII